MDRGMPSKGSGGGTGRYPAKGRRMDPPADRGAGAAANPDPATPPRR